MIAKLLNLRECLIYSQLSRVTFDAVYYVFSHRKQLDFGSALGPEKTSYQIVYSLNLCMRTRAEIITDFCVSVHFDNFAELEGYMERTIGMY